jgi:hydroxymethylpyrimidine pyrophosphatase-like HAD family hydrolase
MLARLRGYAPAQVLAVGDSVNDVSMLDGSHGFRAATVANAGAEIRELVRAGNGYVATRGNGHGVNEVIGRLTADC